jgi:very-short-patch-repair endonuclease
MDTGAAGPARGLPLRLTYGDATTLWRINMGWKRRRPDSLPGFVLDIERGYWQKQAQEEEGEIEEAIGPRTARVIPFVEDRRNCLLIEPATPLPPEVMASLQPALKNALQVRYQLEDSELAAEPLPDGKNRRTILFYEAAEGGAGVLRQLVDDPTALAQVAREALALCHFDPDTGQDRRRAPGANEECEAACYDCLMSYGNQPDHKLLDRHLVRDLLLQLTQATVHASPAEPDRAEHLRRLKELCDSDLEREWLEFLEERNLRLPDEAQVLIAECSTRPDFLYTEQHVAVYVDGPSHDQPNVAAEDSLLNERLEDAGYTVVRCSYAREQLQQIVEQNAFVFGPLP